MNSFYIGACQDDLELRLQKYNNHYYGNHRFTASAGDWELFLDIEFEDHSHAIRLERYIKSMKSRKYIRKLKQYPKKVEKLISKVSH